MIGQIGSKAVEEFQTMKASKERVNVFILCTEIHRLTMQNMTSGMCPVLLEPEPTFADLHINAAAVILCF